jgi:hypothetical protein
MRFPLHHGKRPNLGDVFWLRKLESDRVVTRAGQFEDPETIGSAWRPQSGRAGMQRRRVPRLHGGGRLTPRRYTWRLDHLDHLVNPRRSLRQPLQEIPAEPFTLFCDVSLLRSGGLGDLPRRSTAGCNQDDRRALCDRTDVVCPAARRSSAALSAPSISATGTFHVPQTTRVQLTRWCASAVATGVGTSRLPRHL